MQAQSHAWSAVHAAALTHSCLIYMLKQGGTSTVGKSHSIVVRRTVMSPS